jgi:tetratricopeptide (TPR) repeat protein
MRLLALLAVLAAEPDEAARRTTAEAAARCAEAHLTTLLQLPSGDPRTPGLRLEAAACHAKAGQWGLASIQYERVVTDAPHSPEAEHSLHALVRGNMALLRVAEAIPFAERYTLTYAKSPHTPDMLVDLAGMHHALGRTDLAFAALDRHDKLFGTTDPARTAELYWSRHAWLRTEAERLAHAETYIRRHAKFGGLDRLLVAESTIAQIQWRQACDKGFKFDLCASWRDPSHPPRIIHDDRRTISQRIKDDERAQADRTPPKPLERPCDPLALRDLTVYPRNKKLAAAAQQRFTRILALARDIQIPEDPPQQRRAVADAVAMARFYRADLELEELLAVDPPQDLRLTNDPAALRRLRDHLQRVDTRERQLAAAYAAIAVDDTSPYWSVAAVARIARLHRHTTEHLLGARVVWDPQDPRAHRSHCDALADALAPRRAQADAALEHCLARATQRGWNEYARECEQTLIDRQPRRFPATAEIFGAAQYTGSRPDAIDVQLAAPELHPTTRDQKRPDSDSPASPRQPHGATATRRIRLVVLSPTSVAPAITSTPPTAPPTAPSVLARSPRARVSASASVSSSPASPSPASITAMSAPSRSSAAPRPIP